MFVRGSRPPTEVRGITQTAGLASSGRALGCERSQNCWLSVHCVALGYLMGLGISDRFLCPETPQWERFLPFGGQRRDSQARAHGRVTQPKPCHRQTGFCKQQVDPTGKIPAGCCPWETVRVAQG